MIFAKKWHDGQMRKTGEPYYSHPFAVAATVTEYRFTTNIIIAAILHDVIEDSECTGELIVAEFKMIWCACRIICDEEGNITRLSIETIINNIIKIDDKEAMLIKGVDRLHNLETVSGMETSKQYKTAIETLRRIMQHIAYAVDTLNINDKLYLEEEMYKHCKNILKHEKQ